MDRTLLGLRETGAWQLLRARYEVPIPYCLNENEVDLALGMEKIFTLFLFFIGGAIAGLFLLLVESHFQPEVTNRRLRSVTTKPFFVDTALITLQQLRAMTLPLDNDEDGIIVKMDDIIRTLETAKNKGLVAKMKSKITEQK